MIMDTNMQLVNELKAGAVFNGFYFRLGNKDVFLKTEYKTKSPAFLTKIIRAFSFPDNSSIRKELAYYLTAARCAIKTTSRGGQYFNIFSDTFSGYGSDDINDGKTIVVEI